MTKSITLILSIWVSCLFSFAVQAQLINQTEYDFIVAQDGTGNFKTVQEAINAVPDYRAKETKILIKQGTYKEKIIIAGSKNKVTLIGENLEKTILTYDDYAQKKTRFGEEIGTSGTASVFVYGTDFKAIGITFENTAGPVGQAVALYILGDRAVLYNCRFLGFQDTLYAAGINVRQYYEKCYIEGTTDFIFGSATAWFENCTIHCKKNSFIAAANTPQAVRYGYIFNHCTVTADPGVDAMFLGRPWRPYSMTLYMNCTLPACIRPEGWDNWRNPENEKTARYMEYNNNGPGAATSQRVKWVKLLTPEEASEFTLEKIMKGDDQWQPTVNQIETPKIPAFPGAEGGGMYTSGGRGGHVYFVNSLLDTLAGDKKLSEGTLRWCLKQPAPRTILFRVAGVIHLQSDLEIRDNTTIAGQSAPGDGICIANNVVRVKGDNIIVRYIRFRMGDLCKIEDDAFTGKGCKNVIIDHCSMSWSTDECSSFYDNENFTMQWCILSESLRKSVHAKGSHGYGGIWGGHTASFHHNLFAHHDSRNPRMCGSRYSNRADLELVDFRNNVIYNWGINSGYAGEGGRYNFVNNYYKAGAASSHTNRIFQPNADDGKNHQTAGVWGGFYVEGNYVCNHPEVTADNWLGIQPNPATKNKEEIRSETPYPMPKINTDSAVEAYEKVLKSAGASFKRDRTDTRIAKETREGLAPLRASKSKDEPGMIDSQNDVGGWEKYSFNPSQLPVDKDRDGIPDQWLSKNYPGKKANDLDKSGYTYLEVYLNSVVQ